MARSHRCLRVPSLHQEEVPRLVVQVQLYPRYCIWVCYPSLWYRHLREWKPSVPSEPRRDSKLTFPLLPSLRSSSTTTVLRLSGGETRFRMQVSSKCWFTSRSQLMGPETKEGRRVEPNRITDDLLSSQTFFPLFYQDVTVSLAE